MSSERDLLRHIVATIAYRGGKALRDAPAGFGEVRAGPRSRSAVGILAHIGDLFDWCLGLADGTHRWSNTKSDDWDGQVARFHAGLAALDARFASDEPLGMDATRLIQGPLADSLTHIGQISLLRGIAESPIRGENYFKAEVEVGRTGPEQNPPVFEFD